jgi:hypothetical protein
MIMDQTLTVKQAAPVIILHCGKLGATVLFF